MSARPPTVAAMLTHVADYLDLADRAVEEVARQQGRDLDLGSGVQGDLRLLSTWLIEHPDVDARIYVVLDAMDAA